MFKRPRLRVRSPLVNASPTLALLFLAASCGSAEQDVADAPEAIDPAPIENALPEGQSLPAVWNTTALDGRVAGIGIADALGSTIAVAYEDGGLQLFNFEAERITDKTGLDIKHISDGRYLLLSGTPLTVFPGINADGQLKAYIHGGELNEPLQTDLQTPDGETAAGLCSGSPLTDADGIMRVAFWTEEAPQTLNNGRMVQIGDNLTFLLDTPVQANQPIRSCLFNGGDVVVFPAPIENAALLERNGRTPIVTLDTSGNYTLMTDDGASRFAIRDGLSVKAHPVPRAMAGTGDARGGGYPGGLIVTGGENPSGEETLVFIDPSDITLAPLGVPMGSPG